MNRKRREANARRALAAGRRPRPSHSELPAEILPRELDVPPGSIDASERPDEARASGG